MRHAGLFGLIASCLLLVGCSGGVGTAARAGTPEPAPSSAAASPAAPTPSAPAPTTASPTPSSGPFGLSVNVANGAKGVPVDTLITVTPQFGRVDQVR